MIKQNLWIPTSINIPTNREKLYTYKILFHPLINSKVLYKEYIFTITAVFKEWSLGWYLSIELETPKIQDQYIRIPYENISTSDSLILENISIIKKCIKIIE